MTDFNKFDSRAASDAGSWMHVKHPSDTVIALYDDMAAQQGACRVKVRGSEGKAANEIASLLKAAVKPKGDQTMEDIHKRLVKLAKPLLAEFEFIYRGDRLCDASIADDVLWWLNLQQINGRGIARPGEPEEKSFAEQVLEHSVKRGNYLPLGSLD